MADIAGQATKAPSVLWAFIKAHYVIFTALIVAAFVFAMAKKDAIVGVFTTYGADGKTPSTVAGDKLPAFLRKWITGATVAVLVLVLSSGDALAAVGHVSHAVQSLCAGAPCAGPAAHGWLYSHAFQVVAWLASAAGSVAFGLDQFSACDTLDLQETNGGEFLNVADGVTATKSQSLYLKTVGHSTTKNKVPLYATDLTIEMRATIGQATTGTATLDDQDMARLIDYVVIKPPLMGNLTDEKSGKGTVIDLVTRFLADQFERSGDAPMVSIVVPTVSGSSTDVIKYLTRPFALRFLDAPLTTCPWLGLLHNMNVAVGVAPDNCLAGVSTGATVGTRSLRASVSYQAVPFWYYPLVAYDRVDAPSSGSNGLTFKNFAGPGPDCTQKVDYVHTIGQLSNLKGLGGNLTFDTITKLLAPRFGLDSITNISHLVKARIRAQYAGHIGGLDYANSGNYVQGTLNEPGMALDKLLFFLLRQPSLNMQVQNMLMMGPKDELPIQYLTSGSRTGEDAFYFGAVRKCDPSFISQWRALPDSRLPGSIDQQIPVTG